MSLAFTDIPTALTSAAVVNGPYSVSYPLASENNYAAVYNQPYIVESGFDSTGTMGSAGIFPNTVLVAQSERQPLGGGYFEFVQGFAEIPSGHNDFQTYTYTFPALANGWRPQWKTLTVVARVASDFYNTDSPQDILLLTGQKYLNQYGWDAGYLDNTTVPTKTLYAGWVQSGVEIIAQDSSLSRYIGPIWRRDTIYIKAQ
jgi:hypothetical protein